MGLHWPVGSTVPGATSRRVSVGVVGGGIGGLSATLSLLRAGFDVQVYEQAPLLGEVGAGLQVSPNAARVLHQLGLAEALAKSAVPPLAWHQRRWDDGRTLLRTPLAGALEAAFGFPQYQIHRADLLAALAQALPADRVHLGHQLTGLADHGRGVSRRTQDPRVDRAPGGGRSPGTHLGPAGQRGGRDGARADAAEAPHLSLNLEGVQRDEDSALLFEVYLNLPPDVPPDPQSVYYVGYFAFFDHRPGDHDQAGGHHHHREAEEDSGDLFVFDITNLANEQRHHGIWSDSDFTVTVIRGGYRGPQERLSVADAARAGAPQLGEARIARATITAE